MATLAPNEVRQLRLIYEDLKDWFEDELAHGNLELAHELLTRRIRPLRAVLLEEEWGLRGRATGRTVGTLMLTR